MRTVPLVLAALGLAVTGCSFSSVDPDASVHISGRALDATGKPLAHAKVLLFKQADIGEVVFGTVLAVGTLGTACLVPDAPAICAKARTATTDSEGRYTFDLKGSDTQGTLGTASTLNVVFSASPGRAGSSTTVSFTAKGADIALPDARAWNAGARATSTSRGIRLSWTRLPAAAGGSARYSAQLFSNGGRSALWSQAASGSSASIDPRILEDRSGAVAAGASTTLSGGSGTGQVRAGYLSPRVPVRATAGAPPSRGVRCAAVVGLAHAPFTRCAETDGDLDRPAHLSMPGGGVVSGVVIDLGATRLVGLVVARGFAGQFIVETSTDGTAFTTVATSSGSAAVDVPGHARARYLRLRSPAGLDESLSSEVSAWP
ncbi:MAG: discoidin domain-containing protein [Marmoricola sp.]